MKAGKEVIAATGVNIEWVNMDMGFGAWEKTGHIVTEEHLQAFEKYKVLFKGPLTIPPGESAYVYLRDRKFTSGNQVFRKIYELYANVRPSITFPGVKTKFDNVDLVTVRENTEDVYTGEEEWVDEDTVHGVKRISRKGSTRIARFSFEYARKFGRKTVTAVHKANVCKQADGLFLACCREVAKDYPDIEYNEQLADSLLTSMVIDPEKWDVLCCPNLYGDLVSDLAAGLVGSLGLAPAAMYGDSGYAVFEPAHGSAPDIAGQGVVNPSSLLLSASLMLNHLGETDAGKLVEDGLKATFTKGTLPIDLGGTANTQEIVDNVIAYIEANRKTL